MNVQFSERTFEKYFGYELFRYGGILPFSPGLHAEAKLGFDEGYSIPIYLLKAFIYVRDRRRPHMAGIDREEINSIAKIALDLLPKFNMNLFVQFKCPQYIKSPRAAQWSEWEKNYYRYKITPHQQAALEKLDKIAKKRAAVVYASPAFWKFNDLIDNFTSCSLVDNSNIASVGKLKGHEHYSYVSAGHVGKGHSQTVNIESTPFDEIIKSGQENEALSFRAHLKNAAKTIVDAMNESDQSSSAYEHFTYAREAFGVTDYDQDSFYDAWVIINAFSDAFDVEYFPISYFESEDE